MESSSPGLPSLRLVSERLSLRELNRATLQRQALIERAPGPVAEVVGRLAGFQAQHANAPDIALWWRRHDRTIADLEDALIDRSVLKASLMRATLHMVASADFAALDVASAQWRIGGWTPTAEWAGIDLMELNRALIEFCRDPRTVAEIESYLAEAFPGRLSGPHLPAGVRNSGFRMAGAAGGLVHVPPSGLWKHHGRPSYVESLGMAGRSSAPSAQTALERYLGAYGPASVGDIVKWTGQGEWPRSGRP